MKWKRVERASRRCSRGRPPCHTPPVPAHTLGVRILGCLMLLAAGCGDDGGGGGATCAEGEVSADLLAPQEGQTIGPTDDADLDMVGLQYDVRVRPCGFMVDEQMVVWLLDPVESEYAFLTNEGDGVVLTGRVPFIPGPNRLVVRTRDGVDVSDTVSFTVVEE